MKHHWKNRLIGMLSFVPKADIEIAISGAFLSFFVGSNHNFPKPILYAFFVFFATLFLYNLMRSASLWRESKKVHDMNKMLDVVNHFVFAALTGLAATILFVALLLPLVYYLFIGILGIISVFYRFSCIKIGAYKIALSDVPYVKLFILATVWTLTTVYLPHSFAIVNFRLIAAAWLMFFSLGIPFDVRDLNKDDPSRRTMAQLLGANKALFLSGGAFTTSFFLLENISFSLWLALVCALFYIILLFFIKSRPSFHWLYRCVDLFPLAWVLVLL